MVTSARPRRTTSFYAGASYVAGDSVGYLLNQVVISMRRQIEQAMTAHDLTAAQWYPLWKLKRDGPGTAQELARDMDIDAGAMTRLIDRLAAKGLVERLRSVTDRRVVMLTLTPAGEAVAAHIPQVLAEVNNAYLRGFSRDEWQLLKQLLRRMLDSGPPRRHSGGGS
ncbi:MAG: MarR family transcriptional regulator [Burkholderiaceae bacterium]|jgi:DNA-binding MarR family transcriptional regulator|nr:MarR family transcriptional regulator [Burkholderiaceae bacterium]MCU0963973.1 MarR family transcriptional regulator [Burkholderiaceae bacterium]